MLETSCLADSPVLEIRGLCKKFDKFILGDLDLTLTRGFVMGFIGPNGSGKTTTIKLIMNLLRKDSGIIKVFGLDNVEQEKAIKNRIGFVYDENHYYSVLTINEMKKIIAPLYDNWDEKTFQRYLREFDLNPRQKIDSLSKGMKTKFSLAIALSHQAELIIMDEPTSGLDPVFRSELLDILYYMMQDEKKSILFSTHITSDLERIADYIAFINNGKIIFAEEKDRILEEFSIVKGPMAILEPSLEKEFIGIRKSNVGFEGLTNKQEKIRRIFENKVKIEKPSLDDIMIYHVRTR